MTSATSSEARRGSTESSRRRVQGDADDAVRLLPPSAARDSFATADADSATASARDREEATVAGAEAQMRQLKDTWRQEQHRLRQRLVVGDALDCQPPPLLHAPGNAEMAERSDNAEKVEGAGNVELSQIQLSPILPPPVHPPQIRPPLALVGGVDVSFHRRDPDLAAACLTVVAFPSLRLLHHELALTRVTQPYIPGFLAFRECGVLEGLIRRLRDTLPHLVPQVIMVDGNGIFHPQGFGLACQLGVQADVPTIGVAKNMYYMDGMTDEQVGGLKQQHLHQPGDWAALTGASGATHAAPLSPTRHTWHELVLGGRAVTAPTALVFVAVGCRAAITAAAATAQRLCKHHVPKPIHDPVYVSVGHRVSLQSAVAITQRCCKHRVPEPVRLADGLSRAELRGVTVTEAVGGEQSGSLAEQRGVGKASRRG
ncbi:unnamed protein product [Closterium sp. NIES-64]|nr:unnamed protein product [Closterium sp. NIES-64]